ncbi:CARDB domain-containing protein [Nocardioides sp. SYSU D00038]|uniref:CARDB domain-containing protein n=1 Tax=Nocardioides sp. SYSU D00038 TaxID=2812554 RepID=UPI001966EBB5|nr:CARDB domain-containing protein [Nocardioides sp. SYSU D00038]
MRTPMRTPMRTLGARRGTATTTATALAAAAALAVTLLGTLAPPHADAAARGADPAVASVRKVPAHVTTGDRLTVRALVVNRGSARSAATPLRLLLSRDGRPSKDDRVAGRGRVPALAARARTTRPVTVRVPAAKEGRYRVIVCLAPKKAPRSKAERKNDCEVGPWVTLHRLEPGELLPWAGGRLVGDIALRESGHTVSSGRDRTWDRWGDIEIDLAAASPTREPHRATFADAGGRYTWTGFDTYTDGGEACTFWWEEVESGEGPLGGGRVSARFLPGVGARTLEITLRTPYHVEGRSGPDCREEHHWADDRSHTTVLLVDLKGVDAGHAYYVARVWQPAGSRWQTAAGTLVLTYQPRPL